MGFCFLLILGLGGLGVYFNATCFVVSCLCFGLRWGVVLLLRVFVSFTGIWVLLLCDLFGFGSALLSLWF